MTSAERGVCGLEAPRDECCKTSGLFLQFVETLEVIDAMLVLLADTEHHRRGRAHADLVRGAMHVDPIIGQALEASDLVADFVVENFRASAWNGIETGIA